ncbi:hypothetical protein FG379_001307 [Cryptosporidium bovis]|uniref:uncharacterized protein n=1 Tax=Cryptosporidium bovis TaxID=310047 RepID=UPI00351A3E27|nr:hypothetical protein FG379_001307 [Cryptosporidium bovis]
MTCILYRKEHVRCGLIHPNGKLIVLLVSSNVNTVELYRIDSANRPIKLLWSYQIKHVPNCLDWCNDDKSICIGDSNGNITIIDMNGTIKNQNGIHTQYNEVTIVKSKSINIEYKNSENKGIYPKYLVELINIEPYIISLRDFVSNDFSLNGIVQNFIDNVNFKEDNNDSTEDYIDDIESHNTEYMNLNSRSLNGELLNDRNIMLHDGVNQNTSEIINRKEIPKLIPDFSGSEKEISIFVSLDNNNNMICSIGGHTPIWNYKINGSNNNKVSNINIYKNYIVIMYNKIDDNLNYKFEVIDVKYFLESFNSIFSVFGYIQYIRQLTFYLKGVIKQIYSVWKIGIVPFRQFINGENNIKKNSPFIIIYSIVFGLPLNTYITKDILTYDLNITIDQLVVICQNIDDSVRYMLYVLSNTVHPILEHISIIWDIMKSSDIIIEMNNFEDLEKQIDELLVYYKNIIRELGIVCPIINVFIHILSIVKTYMESPNDFGFDEIGLPRIISSNNSNLISDKFHINERDYQTLKEFIIEKDIKLDNNDLNIDKMDDNSKTSIFFDYIEFKNIDELLIDETRSEFSINQMNLILDRFYKLLVEYTTEKYIINNVLFDFNIELNSNTFSNIGINNSLNINIVDNNSVMFITLFSRLKDLNEIDHQNAIVKVMVEFGNDEVCGLFEFDNKQGSNNNSLNNVNNNIIINYKSNIYSSFKAKFSLYASIISLPNSYSNYKILDIIWTNHSEVLVLIKNGSKSSYLINFNLDLLNFCSISPFNIDIGNHSQDEIYYNYMYNISKCINDSNYYHSISNIFHHLKDVSRIHRPQKTKRFLIDTTENSNCENSDCNNKTDNENHISNFDSNTQHNSTEIINFYSKNNMVS